MVEEHAAWSFWWTWGDGLSDLQRKALAANMRYNRRRASGREATAAPVQRGSSGSPFVGRALRGEA